MPGLPPMCSLCQEHLEHALCGPGSSVLWSLLRGVQLLLGDGTDCVGAAPSPDILLLGGQHLFMCLPEVSGKSCWED